MTARAPKVILASGSPYRRELLARLLLEFDCRPLDVDETEHPGEAPEAIARRLAHVKAEACAAKEPGAVIIGGDQVPSLDGEVLRKPGSRSRAAAQLSACSGRSVTFYTAVCVMGPDNQPAESHVDRTVVQFRRLTPAVIERYLDRDTPYDCAGSFKAEALGIALFERVETHDPTALQGLPLIWLSGCLARRGVQIP